MKKACLGNLQEEEIKALKDLYQNLKLFIYSSYFLPKNDFKK